MNATQAIASLPAPAARLLAVEILLSEPEALGDDVLESCLYLLRDKLRRHEHGRTELSLRATGSHTDGLRAADPFVGAVGETLVLPDRHRRLQLVDQRVTGVEGLRPVRARHADDDRQVPHVQVADRAPLRPSSPGPGGRARMPVRGTDPVTDHGQPSPAPASSRKPG
jgi:hypothetical protein